MEHPVLPSTVRKTLNAFSQAARQHLRESGGQNAPLRFLHVVFHAALVINHAVHIKHAVGGAGVSVPGLADGTHVNKVLVGFEKLDVPGFIFLDAPFMADEGAGDVRMTVEAQELIVSQHVDAVRGRVHIRDVGPGIGLVLGGVHQNDFIGQDTLEGGAAKPLLLFFGKLLARPYQGFVRHGVHARRIVFPNGFLIMVAAHGGNLASADELKAFGRIGVVAHNITQAVNGVALKLFYILHHRFQSGQIGMDVTDQGYSTHGVVEKKHSIFPGRCQAPSAERLKIKGRKLKFIPAVIEKAPL